MDDPINHETNPFFPTGPWNGYFEQGVRYPMVLDLTFADGRMHGRGTDNQIGAFVISGTYDVETGKVSCTKVYPSRLEKHNEILYEGYNEGRGIWGFWDMPAMGTYRRLHGNFRLWPKGMHVSDDSSLHESVDIDDAIDFSELASNAVGRALQHNGPEDK